MKRFKKMIALATLLAMFGSSAEVCAQQELQYSSPTGGCGYEECRNVPSLAPAIALGTIAIVAIVAVAVQNRSSSSHSGHGHCN